MWTIYPRGLFDTIREIETGGHPDPSNAVGQHNELGPYQITEEYWVDAITHKPGIGGTYDDVRNQYYAEWIMMAYWDRHTPDWKPETLARVHNGGPNGYYLKSTDKYWEKFKRIKGDTDANSGV